MQHEQLSRRAKKTREEIFVAAMDLFAQRGVANVSMQEIADQAETARSTVFKHYPQKQALLSEFFIRLGTAALESAKLKNADSFGLGMTALFEAMEYEALKVESVLREVAGMAVGGGPLASEEAEVDSMMIDGISDLLHIGVKDGDVRKDIDIAEAAKVILCVLTDTNHDAISKDRIRFLAAEQQARFDMLFQGLAVSPIGSSS